MPRVITARVRAFLDAFWDGAQGSAVKAAQMAGYKNPIVDGPRVKRRYRDILESGNDKAILGPEEAQLLLSEVARCKGHKDQVRALSLFLEMYGLVTSGSVEQREMRKQVENFIRALNAEKRAALQRAVLDVQPVLSGSQSPQSK